METLPPELFLNIFSHLISAANPQPCDLNDSHFAACRDQCEELVSTMRALSNTSRKLRILTSQCVYDFELSCNDMFKFPRRSDTRTYVSFRELNGLAVERPVGDVNFAAGADKGNDRGGGKGQQQQKQQLLPPRHPLIHALLLGNTNILEWINRHHPERLNWSFAVSGSVFQSWRTWPRDGKKRTIYGGFHSPSVDWASRLEGSSSSSSSCASILRDAPTANTAYGFIGGVWNSDAFWTPLHIAAATGNVETVRWLVARGAKLDAASALTCSCVFRYWRGEPVVNPTPLHLAICYRQTEAAMELVRLGAKVLTDAAPGPPMVVTTGVESAAAGADDWVDEEKYKVLVPRMEKIRSAFHDCMYGGNIELAKFLLWYLTRDGGKEGGGTDDVSSSHPSTSIGATTTKPSINLQNLHVARINTASHHRDRRLKVRDPNDPQNLRLVPILLEAARLKSAPFIEFFFANPKYFIPDPRPRNLLPSALMAACTQPFKPLTFSSSQSCPAPNWWSLPKTVRALLTYAREHDNQDQNDDSAGTSNPSNPHLEPDFFFSLVSALYTWFDRSASYLEPTMDILLDFFKPGISLNRSPNTLDPLDSKYKLLHRFSILTCETVFPRSHFHLWRPLLKYQLHVFGPASISGVKYAAAIAKINMDTSCSASSSPAPSGHFLDVLELLLREIGGEKSPDFSIDNWLPDALAQKRALYEKSVDGAGGQPGKEDPRLWHPSPFWARLYDLRVARGIDAFTARNTIRSIAVQAKTRLRKTGNTDELLARIFATNGYGSNWDQFLRRRDCGKN